MIRRALVNLVAFVLAVPLVALWRLFGRRVVHGALTD